MAREHGARAEAASHKPFVLAYPSPGRGVQTLAHGVSHGSDVPDDCEPRRGD